MSKRSLSEEMRGFHFYRGHRGVGGRNNRGSHSASAPFNRGIHDAQIESRDEQRATGRIGGVMIAVGERNLDTGCESPVGIQHRQRGALPGNNFTRQ
jgi:hypothetical protein